MNPQVTSLKVIEGPINPDPEDKVKFLMVNVTFKLDSEDPYGLWSYAKDRTKQFVKRIAVDDPEKLDEWYNTVPVNQWFSRHYPGYSQVWASNDAPWQYLEKYDTFWLREWVSDCPVTRAIIQEISHYKNFGKFPCQYRSTDEHILLKHLETLEGYWD